MNMEMQAMGAGRSGRESALKILARESPIPIEILEQIYECELTKLQADARISIFIHVCAIRRVRDILRQGGAGFPPRPEQPVQQRARRQNVSREGIPA